MVRPTLAALPAGEAALSWSGPRTRAAFVATPISTWAPRPTRDAVQPTRGGLRRAGVGKNLSIKELNRDLYFNKLNAYFL